MKKIFQDLSLGLCQMNLIPGQPELNADYIIKQVVQAEQKGIELIIFPELSVSGYLIGDLLEDQSFLKEVFFQNKRIQASTKDLKVAVVFGSIVSSPKEKNEDGRPRIHNAGLVVQAGKLLGVHKKNLLPNYRIFDDRRHFYAGKDLEPIVINSSQGLIKVGLMVCEDMWHEDYDKNPGAILALKGAEILINISSSPWTWQKNDKRHRVVKNLLAKCQVPLVYVNNVGIQNTGKNIVVFDGSSTVYNMAGEIVYQVPTYAEGIFQLTLNNELEVLKPNENADVAALYEAITHGIKGALELLPEEKRKVVVGLSGGIDSALVTALFVAVLGRENVFTYNLPSKYNSAETKNIAETIANNLGVSYEVIPIQSITDSIAQMTKCSPDTLAYQNIQARARMEILATQAQLKGGVFTSNGNKTELALGYATLYGDMAGFIAPIGDLIKYEVYQLANYLNQAVFKSAVIPRECFEVAPSAELALAQTDPFAYGNLSGRGYHDELIRAFIEFRYNIEDMIIFYEQGNLEKIMQLEAGSISKLFPTTELFINDLEKCWRLLYGSYFKRVQSAPLIIVSKRAFGSDLRESMLAPIFTNNYLAYKKKLLKL